MKRKKTTKTTVNQLLRSVLLQLLDQNTPDEVADILRRELPRAVEARRISIERMTAALNAMRVAGPLDPGLPADPAELRRLIAANHPDRNPDGDTAIYQRAVEQLDRIRKNAVPG